MEDDLKIKEEDLGEVDQIYSNEQLDFEHIKKNPVLKPISDINKSFVNFELLIRRAMWEYEKDKGTIDNMIESNPKYSETMIVSKIQSMLSYVKQIIHSQNIQKENMKSTIKEMIKIVKNDYVLLEEESEENIPIEKKPEEKVEEKEKKPKTFHSDLLDEEIPIPEDKLKEEEFDPSGK